MVMYLGNIVELGTKEAIYGNQRHPYTKALLSAVSNVKGQGSKNRIILQGDIPSPVNPPSGCPFHTRCGYCMEICKEKKPELKKMADGTLVECYNDHGHAVAKLVLNEAIRPGTSCIRRAGSPISMWRAGGPSRCRARPTLCW